MLKLIIAMFVVFSFINLVSLQAKQNITKKTSKSLEYNCLTATNVNKKNIKDTIEVMQNINSSIVKQLNSYLCPKLHTSRTQKIKPDVLKKMEQLKNKQAGQLGKKITRTGYKLSNTSITIRPPAHKTKYSVVLMHGLFKTPRQMDKAEKIYAALGFNVINLRLPGHGTKNYKSLKKLRWEDWDKELKQTLKIAQGIGDKVLVSGHSTGGLLAYKAAIDYVHSPKNNTAIYGMLNFSPALKTSNYSNAISYFGAVANSIFPNITNRISGYPPEPGIEVSQLSNYLINKYAKKIKKNEEEEEDVYSSNEFIDWDKERIKEIYSKLKNMPILQVDSKYDTFIDYDTNKQVMRVLKKQNPTLHIQLDPCLTTLFNNNGEIGHMTSPMYLSKEWIFPKSNKNNLACSHTLRKDQLKIFKFIDKNFPGRCD